MRTREQIERQHAKMHREFAKMRNNPTKAGQLAGRKEVFGDRSRYAVAPVHTRFDSIAWFVWDSETTDPVTGELSVIRQSASRQDAMAEL